MNTRAFGRTGIQVSPLGFGAMRLPMLKIGGHDYVDIDRAVDAIRHAFSAGVNYIDTGFMYGSQESELAVGRALKGWRDRVTVTTKATKMRMSDPGDLRRMLEHQLRKLDLDCVDFYCFHGIAWDGWHEIDARTGWIGDLTRARDEGLVRRIGFSFHDKPESLPKLVDTGVFDMVTCQYNYLDTRNADGIAYAHAKGLGVVVMGPVGGGRLAELPGFLQRASGLDTSSAAGLAIRFVLSNPHVHVALSGMGSRAMVDENVAAAEAGPLGAGERESLQVLLEQTKRLADLYCTGCGYCMPCPKGVDIPGRFTAMNQLSAYGLAAQARRQYEAVRAQEDKTEGKGVCVECGACEAKCPQKIPIIRQLKETQAALAAP